MTFSATSKKAAFSLVEITFAMALVAFCLVTLLALLPAGVDAVRNSTRSAEAMRLLKQFATGMQGAALDAETGRYRMVGLGNISDIQWLPNGISPDPVQLWISSSGMPVTNPGDATYVCHVSLTPPDAQNPASYGKAHWQIAWPATAKWSGKRWMNAHGHEEVFLMFRKQ